jgi:hypothetical protein
MPTSSPERRTLAAILIGIAGWCSGGAAAELVYVYSPTCGACKAFERDVGGIYDRTEEAERAPMVRIDIEAWPSHPLVECTEGEVIGTPTFILVDQCRELDRISGYSSDELFWLGMQRMLNGLP